jgi:nickel/cobalt transporter (NicO) family protein
MRRRHVSLFHRIAIHITIVLAIAAAGSVANSGNRVSAHPLGELTINHYSEIQFTSDQVSIRYVIDFAELSALEQIRLIDGASELDVDGADLDGYLADVGPRLAEGLDLEVEGEPVGLNVEASHAEFLPGNWGFNLLRVELSLSGDLPVAIADDEVSGRYVVRNYPGRLGWHEVVIPPGDGVTVLETDALRESVSDELRDYPDVAEQDPLQIYDVEFHLGPGDERSSLDGAAGGVADISESGPSALQRLTSGAERLVDIEGATPLAMMLTMLGAFIWGAAHALSPGHGKAVVGAYLIGSRGTAGHAAFLGLTVTATHTAGIFALGFVTLALSHLILPDAILPWLSVVSGVLVILIGLGLGYRRQSYRATGVVDEHGHHDHHHGHHDHDHEHDHHHAHPHDHDHAHHHHHHGHSHLPSGADGTGVTWRSLLALGISGGMVPCPSALVLLLGAISLGRVEFGIVLVLLFSVGLAAVLTAIGLAMVYMRAFFNRYAFETRVPGLLPVLSSVAIAIAGVIIVAGAIHQTGMI